MDWRRTLLWIDGLGGVLVGSAVLLAGAWLVTWYGVPRALVLGMAVANLAYGSYSISLARRATRPMALITLLVVANAAWAVLCFIWTGLYWDVAHPVARAHIAGEGLFVGGLAVLEWANRYELLTAG